jgi:tetratricopeptide (TPR) repeat protein
MPVTCDRHPTQPAWWNCPRCNKNLCPQCISKRSAGQFQEQTLYFCPKCNVEASDQDLYQVIPPFWTRLHRFFVYPFSSIQSISVILVLSLLSTLLAKSGLLFMGLNLLLWAIMVKYSFESLRMTAEGRLTPPPLSEKVMVEDYGIVFKQIVLYVALILFFFFVVVPAGPFFIILYLVFCGLTLPSMLTILIINDSLIQALNPVMVVGAIFRIGWSYLLLLLFLLLLSGAPAALYFAVIQHLPEKVQLFMHTIASNYYTLITYHMVGYVILQYHHRVGYPVDLETILASMFPAGVAVSQVTDSAATSNPHEDLLDEIGLLVQEGNLDAAIALIEQRVDVREIDDPVLSERYVGLLKMQKQEQKLLAYAPRHLELAVKAGSKKDAVALYMHCLRNDKSFAPEAIILFKIASWLNESEKSKEAIFALNALIKRYPQDTMVPKAYYRAAQIFHERLKNDSQSKKILNGLIRKFPDHEIAGFAKNYLKGLLG